MSKLRRNGRHTGHAFILAPCHVSNELVKLLNWDFTAVKLLLKKPKHHLGNTTTSEAKTPPRTSVNKLLIKTAANNQQGMYKMPHTIKDVRLRLATIHIQV